MSRKISPLEGLRCGRRRLAFLRHKHRLRIVKYCWHRGLVTIKSAHDRVLWEINRLKRAPAKARRLLWG